MTPRVKSWGPNLSFSFRGNHDINERLLQFLWQFQYFNQRSLATAAGEEIQVIFPGYFNTDQGPDFSDAKIRIGTTTWAGNVELHCKTSDWNRHNHQHDQNYRNVILHVVWEHDETTAGIIPVLQLKDRVSKILMDKYQDLMNAGGFIPCANSIHSIRELTWTSWKERLVAERLIRKAKTVQDFFSQSKYHWEECFWWLLARNFGTKVNSDAFEAMARSLSLSILARHKNQVIQLEALLAGQCGLLEQRFSEDYPNMLRKEFQFLQRKYGLKKISIPVFFLRMRPRNFPTVRLAQLAMLIQHSAHLFSKLREASSVTEIKKWFDVSANDYWHYHYRFDEISPFKKKNLGFDMINNIIINTIVPVLFAYGDYHGEQKYKVKAINWLEETEAESNTITRGFEGLTVENKTAFDSQALIELKTQYCDRKKCLDCGVGNQLLHGIPGR